MNIQIEQSLNENQKNINIFHTDIYPIWARVRSSCIFSCIINSRFRSSASFWAISIFLIASFSLSKRSTSAYTSFSLVYSIWIIFSFSRVIRDASSAFSKSFYATLRIAWLSVWSFSDNRVDIVWMTTSRLSSSWSNFALLLRSFATSAFLALLKTCDILAYSSAPPLYHFEKNT